MSGAHGLCDVHCYGIWYHTDMCLMPTDCVMYIATEFGIISYRHVSGAHGLYDVHCYGIWYHTAMCPMRTDCVMYIATAFSIITPCVRCAQIV